MASQSISNQPSVGVVIPSYKESENIVKLLNEILKHVPTAQIAVVDDSPDMDTVAAVQKAALANVTCVHRTSKGGRGSAVLEGLKLLTEKSCTQFVEIDADFSHPPSQLPSLLSEARERKLDMLVASRYLRDSAIKNWPISRRVFSKCSNILARIVLGVPIADYTNGYRIYSLPAVRVINETCGKYGRGFISLSEILVNLYFRGYQIGESPTIFINRTRGESSVNSQEIKNAITGLFKIYSLKRQLQKSSQSVKE
jgi:dolichol-phosphate mannosyltransferase